jgi:hypothetical protein
MSNESDAVLFLASLINESVTSMFCVLTVVVVPLIVKLPVTVTSPVTVGH